MQIRWAAPEYLSRNAYLVKNDVWSFGILCYEVLTYGRLPYESIYYNIKILR